MTKIYYWQGAFGQDKLLSEHHKVILKILNQDYAPNDLEKLHVNSKLIIYSFRLNIQHRLLFTTIIIKDKSYLHVLEYIENHDYQKSRFINRPQVLNYVNTKLNQGLNSLPFEPIDDNKSLPTFEKSDTTADNIENIGLDHFNQQFIELKDNQEEALYQPLPLILNGVGGSGKTYTALAIIRKFIDDYNKNQPGHIIYVTKEPNLVDKIKIDWIGFCEKIPESIQVEHITYLELLQKFTPIEAIIADHYAEWAKYQKHYSADIDGTTQYSEFRICSAYTKEQYINLGANQSRLDHEQRIKLYEQYEDFQFYLNDINIDPVFSAFTAEPTYQLIVVDEAQLFSLRQLQNIHQLAINSAILYCMDPLQNIIDTTAIRQLFQQLHWSQERGLNINTINLDKTYRCSESVARTVNVILTAKQEFMGKVDKTEANNLIVDNSHTDTGYAALTSEKQLTQYQAILERNISPDFAVITHPEFIETARKRFQTPLVFTVNQIQGLDYHTIVIYKLFSDKISKNNLKKFHESLLNNKDRKISQEDKRNNRELATWFNSLYTAYTRAKHTLLIIEETSRHNAIFQRITQTTNTNTNITNPELSRDWHAETQRQQELGNDEIAELIKQQHVTPIASSIEIDKLNQESQKNTQHDSLINKAMEFLKKFNEQTYFEDLMKNKDFLAIVFESEFSLDNKVTKSFFQHIIENNEFTAKFCDGLSSNKKITLDFVKKAIEYSDIPFEMLKILIVNILIFNLQLLENSLVAKQVDENFEKLATINQKAIQREIACIIIDNVSKQVSIWILCLLDLFKSKKTLFFPVVFSKILATKIDNTNITPLYSLTAKSDLGIKLLSYFVDKNEDVLVNIKSKVWKTFLVNRNGTNTDMNPLIKLIYETHGVEVFNKFLKSKSFGPILIQIYIELCNITSNKQCSLLWFTIAQNGTEVLKTIIDDHGNKIQDFLIESWVFLTKRDLGLDIYSSRSAIFELTTTDEGLMVLEMLINQHYNIIEKISHETWEVQTGDKGNMSSALYNLVKSEKGLKILEMLIERKNNIINLPLSAWKNTVIEKTKMTIEMIFKNQGKSIFKAPQALFKAPQTLSFSALDFLMKDIEKYPDKEKILNELKKVYGNDFGNESSSSKKSTVNAF